MRLSKDNNRVAILTCTHVVRPPYLSAAQKKSKTKHREEVIALGTIGFNNGLTAMMGVIRDLYRSIEAWNWSVDRLGKFQKATLSQRNAMSIWIWWRRQQRRFKWLTCSTTRSSSSTAPSNSARLDLSSTQRRLRFRSSPTNLLTTGPRLGSY
ncbi:hypothetical protein K443DRAFT_664397 [Laccaria amethystina LaAM-08-1]|uniref:Unplaced genomic scaffold K443scaffold_84, whole genome shotgun sequence n=1 Tax=Laccaria amethystina LaAM-08-1 TaxID=1095629 RepID=A0A0C9X6Q9_9AGAR|nr:hypothetical protein K443DRAFT_664397 [Laccaria amethystina LaAM-08-1]